MALYTLCTISGRLRGARTSLPRMSIQCNGSLRRTLNTKVFSNQLADLVKARSFREVPHVPLLPPLDALGKPWRLGGLSTREEICETGAHLFQKYGPIVREKFAGRYTVVHLFSPRDFHTVFQEEGEAPFRIGMAALKHYRDKVPKEYADASILHLQGEKWSRLRCATQEHVLRNQAASSYVSALNSVAQDAVDVIDDLTDQRGEIPDCFHFMRRWALESITLICIGHRLGAISPVSSLPSQESASVLEEIMTSLHCLSAFAKSFPYYRYFPTLMWRKFQRAMDDYTAHITGHIRKAASSWESSDRSNPCTILSRLLQEDKLNFAEIVTFTRDIILGGIETVALVVTACLQHLARHPDAQVKARTEVAAVFAEDVPDFQPDHVDRLPYLNACVKESMRLTPSVPGIVRKLNHDTILSGYLIPAKTTIYLQTMVASQLDNHFSKPEEFQPERWLLNEERADDWVHQASASLPFGAGKRPCLGRRIAEFEIFIILSKVLLKYSIEHHHPDVGFYEKIYMIPKGPTRFCFKPINDLENSK